MATEAIIEYARRIREQRRAGPSNLEQALAPEFQRLLEFLLPRISSNGLIVVPEYATPGIGRPDIALKRAGQPPRAFVELKAPTKPGDPSRYRDPHDKQQFERFKSLPVWAISNFSSFRVFRRDEAIASIEIVPEAALNPETTEASAERLIRRGDPAGLIAALTPLALADPPPAKDAEQLAGNLAHAARLVRSIVADRLAELADSGAAGTPLQAVRDDFREVLYAHPQAAGYSAPRFETLFAAAFAQTLAFGLLLVREATDKDVDRDAWRNMPPEHSLLRTTLRVLSMEEIVIDVGVGFDVILDTVNSFDPEILARKTGKPDPILYFYEDFLRVFDPVARERYGVYYTPVEVVTYMVAALDRALRENLGTTGLADDSVTLLDPAAGTGTFLLGVIEHVRASVESSAGPGAVAGALRALASRLFGFELLVGPYAVAHYRLRHGMGALQANQRLGVFLTDTLARPGAAAPLGSLGFVAENIRTERHEADRIKERQPILAIIGNPPYRRLEAGEVGELVGDWMNDLWDDLKAPVRDAGWGNQLNTFPELSVAFWRWAIWKLFESEGAPRRGVVAFISNRTFLAGKPYAGLRAMLRERFDRIEIIDLRGDVRRGERAGVDGDQGVFNIQVGTAITHAIADGSKARDALARVTYIDSWAEGLFARDPKLKWLLAGSETGTRPGAAVVDRGRLDPFKPKPFQEVEWASLSQCFIFNRSGLQTKRDDFVYAFQPELLEARITGYARGPDTEAKTAFHETGARTWHAAKSREFSRTKISNVAYRPLDNRALYNDEAYVDRPRPELQAVWSTENCALYAIPFATGAGPAVWCHGLLPDYHAFRGSYGGYAFPLRDNRAGHGPFNVSPNLLAGLAANYGAPVSAQDAFDAILALLSATSYTLRFAEDLEDVFPHVPFPSDHALFLEAAALGREIRAVETFEHPPRAEFLNRTVARVESEATETLHVSDWSEGEIFLCANRTGRVSGVSAPVWDFSVSGYRLLFRWLDARQGLPVDHALITALRDLVGRIAELIDLFARADQLLERALGATLSREALGLREAEPAAADE
ncbi:MAG: type ISP restriction/modification enzyme [Roseiarcus sp.]